MCENRELKRDLMSRLNQLPSEQFDQLISDIQVPNEILSHRNAPRADRVTDLLNWAKSPTRGDALRRINALLNQMMPLSSNPIIHPLRDDDNDRDTHLDVIFIHGLFGIGQGLNAWQAQLGNFCWLELLREETNSTIWVVDYTLARITLTSDNALSSFCSSLIRSISIKKIGNKPIVFVAHDLGGLILKQIMLSLISSKIRTHENIRNNTIGLVFISVPHCDNNVEPWFSNCFENMIRNQLNIELSRDHYNNLDRTFKQTNSRWNTSHSDLLQHSYYVSTTLRGDGQLVGEEVSPTRVNGSQSEEILNVPIPHNSIHQPPNEDSEVYSYIHELLNTDIIFANQDIVTNDKIIFFRQENNIKVLPKRVPAVLNTDADGLIEDEQWDKDKLDQTLAEWERLKLWDKLELWKQIHYIIDDIKTILLRKYHNIYCFYDSTRNNIEIKDLVEIRNIMRDYLMNPTYLGKIREFRRQHQDLIKKNKENNIGYNKNQTLYVYANFLLDINDILPTIYNCFPIPNQRGLSNDIHKDVATTIQDWLDTSLRQADQMIIKFIYTRRIIDEQRSKTK